MNIVKRNESKTDLLKKNRFLIFLVVIGLLLILLGVFAPYIFNRPVPSWLSDRFILSNYSKTGQNFSNYISPFIALLGAILTFSAFYIQFKANQKIQKQFSFQKTSDHFYKMLDIHLSNLNNLALTTTRNSCDKYKVGSKSKGSFTKSINYIIKGDENNTNLKKAYCIIKSLDVSANLSKNKYKISEQEILGRRVFLLMEKDLHLTIHLIALINKKFLEKRLSKEMVCHLAYKIFFWGTNSSHIGGGKESDNDRKFIKETLNRIRKQFRENRGAKYTFRYDTEQGKKQVSLRFIPFSGHSSRLAHYYRHLYQTVSFLHKGFKENLISILDLENHLKTLRAQFSNEEVLLLYYNYKIGFGRNWERNDKKYDHHFFTDYGLIHNIPLWDNIHSYVKHPIKEFEEFIVKQQSKNPNYRMFEWDEGKIKKDESKEKRILP